MLNVEITSRRDILPQKQARRCEFGCSGRVSAFGLFGADFSFVVDCAPLSLQPPSAVDGAEPLK
jgi:hypothetical protein